MPGVPRGVVAQVVQHPTQRGRVAVDPRRRHAAGVHRQAVVLPCRAGTHPSRLGQHQVVEVDRPAPQRQRPLVGLGQQQQVVDERLHAQALRVCGRGPGPRRSMASGWASATSACWRMAAIGERSSCEASATNRRSRARARSSRSSIRFMVSASRPISSRDGGPGHPAMQLRAGDRVGFDADRVDRSQRPADHPPRRGADHEQQHGQPDRQQRRQRPRRLHDRVEALPDAAPSGRRRRPRRRPGSRRRRTARRSGGTRPAPAGPAPAGRPRWGSRRAPRRTGRAPAAPGRRRRPPPRPGHRRPPPPWPRRRHAARPPRGPPEPGPRSG